MMMAIHKPGQHQVPGRVANDCVERAGLLECCQSANSADNPVFDDERARGNVAMHVRLRQEVVRADQCARHAWPANVGLTSAAGYRVCQSVMCWYTSATWRTSLS